MHGLRTLYVEEGQQLSRSREFVPVCVTCSFVVQPEVAEKELESVL